MSNIPTLSPYENNITNFYSAVFFPLEKFRFYILKGKVFGLSLFFFMMIIKTLDTYDNEDLL